MSDTDEVEEQQTKRRLFHCVQSFKPVELRKTYESKSLNLERQIRIRNLAVYVERAKRDLNIWTGEPLKKVMIRNEDYSES